MRLTLASWIFALVALAISTHFVPLAFADPGDTCQTSDDCDEGERCQKEVCVVRKPRAGTNQGDDRSGAGPGGGNSMFCCDAFGNRRCVVGTGVSRPGDPCFCVGQGFGRQCN